MHFNAASTVWFIVITGNSILQRHCVGSESENYFRYLPKTKKDSNISWKEYRLFQDDIYHFTSLLIFLKQILLYINVEELAQNKQL